MATPDLDVFFPVLGITDFFPTSATHLYVERPWRRDQQAIFCDLLNGSCISMILEVKTATLGWEVRKTSRYIWQVRPLQNCLWEGCGGTGFVPTPNMSDVPQPSKEN